MITLINPISNLNLEDLSSQCLKRVTLPICVTSTIVYASIIATSAHEALPHLDFLNVGLWMKPEEHHGYHVDELIVHHELLHFN